ncbi:hypothetical protein B0A49_02414 [Cryomyces minteri]|uniref:Dihydrofolate reductase n=1 Tax=Cryomyces minteri TaxID=331657 RepID=A0A4U0XJ36_9PEZI|nr:hypothetical protein B0A49_02414 [Cryomyces minteri]
MEASLRNTPALIARIEKLTNDLIRRFETLVALAPVERTDRNFTAYSAYQMEVETAALHSRTYADEIRSSEDILTLTRQMQEMWLFGQLSTLGESRAQQKTEEDARAVAEVLARLIQGETGVKVATAKNGIGRNGTLPWPALKQEMAYFARVTRRSPSQPPSSSSAQPQNAVIMGRKTWESIPSKFRPLKGRTNVVLTRQAGDQRTSILAELDEAKRTHVLVAGDLQEGLQMLQHADKGTYAVPPVGKVFVIGGNSLYAVALQLPQTKRILLTRVQKEFDCDTFFPVDIEGEEGRVAGWVRKTREDLGAFVGEEVAEGKVEEQGVVYEFLMYERD